MADQNWRTEVNALDYFGNQKKQASLDNRRPVIRKPSDLVGPGIAANAIRLTDFNDHLATYDGFFSADVGALNAPNSTDAFVGTVTSDETLGGVQNFSGLTTQANYQRVFNRNPSDEATIYWGEWEIVGTSGTGGGTFLETLPASIMDAKGDLIVGAGDNAPVREAVGDDGDSLVADSATATGVGWDTRVRTIVPAPDSPITVDDTDPLNPVIGVVDLGERDWKWDDRYTIYAVGSDQRPRLSYEPVPQSLFVRWHPDGGGGVPLLNEDFTLDGQIVNIPDPGYFSIGDLFSFQYQHNPAPPLELSLVGQAAGVFHYPANTITFTPPVGTQEGDLFVIATRSACAPGGGDVTFGATSADPRVTSAFSSSSPGHEDIFTGFATGSTADVTLNVTPNPSILPGQIGVMAVFRGVSAIFDVQSLVGGTDTPQVSTIGAVAITWAGNSSFIVLTAGPPTGYTDIANTGIGYAATDISYWTDSTANESPVGTFVGQGCVVIGLV